MLVSNDRLRISLSNKHDFSLLNMPKILSSHFFDLDIENPLGRGTLQGGLVQSKISGVGTNCGLLVHVLPGPNKRRVCKPSMILSWAREQNK
jgi:hypothetical protein